MNVILDIKVNIYLGPLPRHWKGPRSSEGPWSFCFINLTLKSAPCRKKKR